MRTMTLVFADMCVLVPNTHICMYILIDTILMYFFYITFDTIAVKEFAFMKALHAHGFPTPTPIDQSRHIVAMSKIEGW